MPERGDLRCVVYPSVIWKLVHVPIFFFLGGLSGSEDRGGVTTVSNSLIFGGWVRKVLKNDDKKLAVEGWVTPIF